MKSCHHKLFRSLLAGMLFTLSAQAENLIVNCGTGINAFPTISLAVAKLSKDASHKALGPSTITVTGSCVENVSIISLDNLTLQASPAGASITDASNGTLDTVAVGDSNRFALNGFTINGSVNCFENAVCRLYGNAIQNSQVGYGLRAGRAHLVSQNDNISNNPGSTGVLSANQSRVALFGDTISNNGGHGVQAVAASFVILANSTASTTISNNAGFGVRADNNSTVRLSAANITGNGFDGIRIQNGSVLRTDFAAPTVNNITGNGWAGVNLGDLSHAFFANDGSTNITGNLGGTDVYCAGQFAATRNVAAVGGTTNCTEPNPNQAKRK